MASTMQPLDVSKLVANGGQIVRAVLEDAKIDTTKFLNAYGKPTEVPVLVVPFSAPSQV